MSRGTLGRRRPALSLLALLAITLLAAPMSASANATPADTAATHALLQARYELNLAVLDNGPSAQASTAKLAVRLGRECHDVLAGEPAEEGVLGPGPPTPRARGERERVERQRQTINEELDTALAAAGYQPVRAAIRSFLAATAPLRWSDVRIAPLVRALAASFEELANAAPPDACADMEAWAQSGYRLLSPASRAFQSARSARAERIASDARLDALLKPFEGASERALLRRTAALNAELNRKSVAASRQRAEAESGLRHALGEPADRFVERRLEPALGHGTTRSGARFTVRREPPGEERGPSCSHAVAVELTERHTSSHGVSSGGSTSGVCVSVDGKRQPPSSGCSEEEVSVIDVVPASVRTVRMRLSNGTTISSAVVRIPRRYGGPVGLYVQAVRGFASYPVSLTELDRHGHVVRVVGLRDVRCHTAGAPARPTFTTLVIGTAPGGERFTIEGVLVKFGHAEHSFSISAELGNEAANEGSAEGPIGNTSPPKAFSQSLAIGCPPQPFALVFGILAAPGDSVLARTPEGLVALTRQELAANLQSGGPLVYGVFSSPPSELIIERSDGSTLYTEILASESTERAEFCEGLAEP